MKNAAKVIVTMLKLKCLKDTALSLDLWDSVPQVTGNTVGVGVVTDVAYQNCKKPGVHVIKDPNRDFCC